MDANFEDSPPTARPESGDRWRRAGHRLGPLVTLVPMEHRLYGRLYAAAVAAAAGVVLFVAATLRPSADHMGTHRQLGLPPCGFVAITRLPCPTCGMTTAFANTVRGRFLDAARAQVAGLVFALGTMVLLPVACLSALTGWRPSVNWYRLDPMRCVWGFLVLLLAAWALKIGWGLLDGALPAHPLWAGGS